MDYAQDEDSRWSEIYDTGRDFTLATSQTIEKTLAYTDKSLPKNHLDLGCGTGQLTRELYHRGYDSIGVDISSTAIRLAKNATIRPGLTYIQADLESDFSKISELSKSKYSLITTKLVFAFIKNKPKFLDNITELLADGGTFVIITPDIESTEVEKRKIAVDCKETSVLLSEVFQSAEIFEIHGLTYFICKNHK